MAAPPMMWVFYLGVSVVGGFLIFLYREWDTVKMAFPLRISVLGITEDVHEFAVQARFKPKLAEPKQLFQKLTSLKTILVKYEIDRRIRGFKWMPQPLIRHESWGDSIRRWKSSAIIYIVNEDCADDLVINEQLAAFKRLVQCIQYQSQVKYFCLVVDNASAWRNDKNKRIELYLDDMLRAYMEGLIELEKEGIRWDWFGIDSTIGFGIYEIFEHIFKNIKEMREGMLGKIANVVGV